MIYIRSCSNDAYFNMALDEYAVRKLSPGEEYFIIYQNSPSVIIGKNQNTIEEVNLDYVKANGIAVVRRLSGGGAVYHDLGNINFTFVVDYCKEDFNSIERFAKAVVMALKKLGISAEFSGRNDITIEGKKISGNAQYLTKNRLLHHGTLLFDSDLNVLSKALKVKADKITSKGIKSVRSRVGCIRDFLSQDVTAEEFIQLLIKNIFEVEESSFEQHVLTPKEIEEIKKLRDEKFATWDWNFGYSPEFELERSRRFPGGHVDAKMNVKNGVLEEIRFYGDFMSKRDVAEVEQLLMGQSYREEALREVLRKVNLEDYFGSIGIDDLLGLMVQ
jgi:lipoate-protein ligase A